MLKFISYRLLYLLVLISAVFLYSCQKEYSYEGGIPIPPASGTAVYTLDGNGAGCMGSVLSGNYFTGVKLDAANTALLHVNVTTAGTYLFTTNVADGISFSASGTFTTTGPQTIIITGAGTPASAGSFSFVPPVGAGCTFAVNVTKAPPIQAAFSLQGAPGKCTNAIVNGSYNPGATLVSSNNIVIYVDVTSPGNYDIKTDTLDGITFSASGKFTSAGSQMVTLVGSGTPALARNLTFTPSSGTSGCTFSLSVVDIAPLATYVLESGFGNPSPCIYTVLGTYTAGAPLSTSNTVSVRVTATVPGNFTIATSLVNGMTFSYSGTFATATIQEVLLVGSGTPVSSGSYTFVPQIVGPHPIGGEACAFIVDVQ